MMDATKEQRGSGRRSGRVARWMYRSGGPNRVAAVLNRAGATVASTGLWRSRMVTLEVRGRRTGRRISFPLVPVEHENAQYLVAMLGPGTGWVANVRSDGGRAVLCAGSHEQVRLEDIKPALRAPVLRRYLQVAPGARAHFPVDRHAGMDAFEAIAAQYPVFRVCRD